MRAATDRRPNAHPAISRCARRPAARTGALCLGAALCVAACASSHELIGTARAPISPAQVRLYTEAPARPYEQIARLAASSKRSFSFTYQGKAEAVVRRLKREAAKLGANGVLLEGISDESSGTVGTDVGTDYQGPRGTAEVGFGASTLMLQRYGRAVAIYLPP